MLAFSGRFGRARKITWGELEKGRRRYLRDLDTNRDEIQTAVCAQREWQNAVHSDPPGLGAIIGGPRMWERGRGDVDFLEVRVPMSAMQPLQSMVGMFANPGALGMGGAAPGASAASAAGGISAAATEVGAGGGGAALGGGGMPATSFTRPVSAFESGTSGRPVGLRPSGALGADVVRAPTTTVGGTPIGGMPVGHAAGGHRGSHGKSEQAATVRVVDDRR